MFVFKEKKKSEGNTQTKPTIILGILGEATLYIVICTYVVLKFKESFSKAMQKTKEKNIVIKSNAPHI